MLSHCILNSCCEIPEASDTLRKAILNILSDKKANVIQLPCPELCFQALERKSIYPGDTMESEYADYCDGLIAPILKNILEYNKHGIGIKGIIGINTSPSCSIENNNAIMMRIILRVLSKNHIRIKNAMDLPNGSEEENSKFIDALKNW